MQNFDRQLQAIYAKSLAEKSEWYSNVATAYDRVRPCYPDEFITRAVEVTRLANTANLLEIGCGPGIATVAFARLGFKMTCIEPSRAACELAQSHCAAFPRVEVVNSTFEEWEVIPNEFDAVVAATSWHWVADKEKYRKVWTTLRDRGCLILLWNTPPEPIADIHQQLRDLYERYALHLAAFAGVKQHASHLDAFGRDVVQSGWFEAIVAEHKLISEMVSGNYYIELLSTLSPYMALEREARNTLFTELLARISHKWNDSMPTQRLSALQVFERKKC